MTSSATPPTSTSTERVDIPLTIRGSEFLAKLRRIGMSAEESAFIGAEQWKFDIVTHNRPRFQDGLRAIPQQIITVEHGGDPVAQVRPRLDEFANARPGRYGLLGLTQPLHHTVNGVLWYPLLEAAPLEPAGTARHMWTDEYRKLVIVTDDRNGGAPQTHTLLLSGERGLLDGEPVTFVHPIRVGWWLQPREREATSYAEGIYPGAEIHLSSYNRVVSIEYVDLTGEERAQLDAEMHVGTSEWVAEVRASAEAERRAREEAYRRAEQEEAYEYHYQQHAHRDCPYYPCPGGHCPYGGQS